MTEKPDNEPDSEIARNVRFGIKVAAYPISFFSGYAAAASIMRNEIYKNVAVTGIFEADKKSVKLAPLSAAVKNAAHPMHEHIPDHLLKLNEDFRSLVRGKFKGMGFNHIGDYWKALNRNQAVEAATMGMTVTGIVLGSLLTVANSKGLVEYLTSKKENEPNSSPDKGI